MLSLIFALLLQLPDQPNVLIVLMDDVGTDMVAAYGEHPDAGPTPVLDTMAEYGVLFRNAYAHPVCSPTRAGIMTGLMGVRTGVTNSIGYTASGQDDELDCTAWPTLPALLGAEGYATALVGKWHLAKAHLSGPDHPTDCGWDTFRGIMTVVPDVASWYGYTKVIDGVEGPSPDGVYITTDQRQDVVALGDSLPQPWVILWAASAPHPPYHEPPAGLHSIAFSDPPTDRERYQAALHALDVEIGNAFAGLRPAVQQRTLLLVVGDNGTPAGVLSPPSVPPAKGSVDEGGIWVPLLAWGPQMTFPSGESEALVHTTDLFATVLELAGGDAASGLDSVSFAGEFDAMPTPGPRPWVYTERLRPNGGPFTDERRAARGPRFKLRREWNGLLATEHLYDIVADPGETTLLLPPYDAEEAAAFGALSGVIGDYEGLAP